MGTGIFLGVHWKAFLWKFFLIVSRLKTLKPNVWHVRSEVKWSEFAQSCPTLCDPVGCSPPGSSVHGIFQAWILEWVAISFSSWSSRPRDRTHVSRIVGRRFTLWATREAHARRPFDFLRLSLKSSFTILVSLLFFTPYFLKFIMNLCSYGRWIS